MDCPASWSNLVDIFSLLVFVSPRMCLSPEWQLVDLLHTGSGTWLSQLSALVKRLDDLSHVLAWARIGETRPTDGGAEAVRKESKEAGREQQRKELPLWLVELPRLRLSFEVRHQCDCSPPTPHTLANLPRRRKFASRVLMRCVPSQTWQVKSREELPAEARERDEVRLYCREHAGLYLSPNPDPSLEPLLYGLPHAVALQTHDGEFALLMSAAAKPVLTPDGRTLLHRGDAAWLANLPQARHYLYPVHPSRTHLCSPTLASSLYLLLLYFLHGMYADVLRIMDACMSDTELSGEEAQLWYSLRQTEQHDVPDAHAARLRLHQMWSALHQPDKGTPSQSLPDAHPSPAPSASNRIMRSSSAEPLEKGPRVSLLQSPASISMTSASMPATPRQPPAPAQREKRPRQMIESPWDAPVARSVAAYVLYRSCVSADCRLSADDELSLLTFCFSDEEQV